MGPEEAQVGRRASWHSTAAATLVFGFTLASLFHAVWGQDLSEVIPVIVPEDAAKRPAQLGAADRRFVVWLIARNAFTMLTRPTRLFDAEQCYPAENALAFGEPGITLGVLGMPAYLLTRDPVATFNFVLLGITLIAAIAMFLLVREWTGIASAGIVAGLLYAFHGIRAANVVTLYIVDNAWTVFALLFARRLFARSRWLDALGLALCCSFQIGGSILPLVPAMVIAVPYVVWLVAHYGIQNLRIAQCVMVIAMIGAASFVVFTPYLELRSAGALESRVFQIFIPLYWLLPGEVAFPGWTVLLLGLAGLTLGRRRAVGALEGDPRWALLLGAVLVLNLAAGGNTGDQIAAYMRGEPGPPELPNLYKALAAVVPGLDLVRGPGAMYSGTLLILCLFAGLGAGAVVRVTPRRYTAYVGVVLILFAFLEVLRPGALGLHAHNTYSTVRVRPSAEAIGFFQELERLGNSGPILELPMRSSDRLKVSSAVLLSAYHHRHTSHCYNSFRPEVLEEVRKMSARLPEDGAIRALRKMGFTTLLVHHPYGDLSSARRREEFAAYAEQTSGALLRRLYGDDSMTAYELDEERPSLGVLDVR